MLENNQLAPSFSSPNQLNEIVSSSDFLGKKNIVLYF